MASKTVQDFGRKVEGEISHYGGEFKEQEAPEAFLLSLDTLLRTEGVKSVVWQQYTPYFNDGDPCEFRIYGEASVKIKGDKDFEDGDYKAGYRTSWDLSYDSVSRSYDTFSPIGKIDGDQVKAVHDALKAFNATIGGGQHFIFLRASFGDPAIVTARSDGSFEVEYYDHD